MKCLTNFIGFLLVGLLCAIFIYPFLHECGHLIFAIFAGIKVAEIKLLSVSYVMCEMPIQADWRWAFVAFGGTVFPMIFVMCFHKVKNFWIWYAGIVIRGIVYLSSILSLIGVFAHISGLYILENDDAVALLNARNGMENTIVFILFSVNIISLLSIYFQHPLKQLESYFSI